MKKIISTSLLAGTSMLLISVSLNFLVNIFLPSIAKEYQTGNLFRPWSDPLMSLIFLHPFILGFALNITWNKVKTNFKSPLYFGLAFWTITTLPGMLISYSSFTISLLIVLIWSLNGLLQILAGSYLIGFSYNNWNAIFPKKKTTVMDCNFS